MIPTSEEAAQERRTNLTLCLFSLVGFGMANWPYTPLAGWGLTGISILLLVWYNWGRARVRRWRLGKPFDLFFDFGGREKWSGELHVPPNKEVHIEFRLEPRISYEESELVFGFDGPEASRPLSPRTYPVHFLVSSDIRASAPKLPLTLVGEDRN